MACNVENVLAHIRERQTRPEGTGNPEGYTEMHTYHVWEVVNALREMGIIPPGEGG